MIKEWWLLIIKIKFKEIRTHRKGQGFIDKGVTFNKGLFLDAVTAYANNLFLTRCTENSPVESLGD